ncbi:MAG: glycosyltransferase family 9 protein [Candidatus Methylomirabilales bacterium]
MPKLLAPALAPVARLARPRITVIRPGGLGDTLLLLAALQWLRARLPGVRLGLVGSAWAAALRPLVPWPLEVFPFDAPALAPLFGSGSPRGVRPLPPADAVVLYTADPGSDFVQNVVRLSACPVLVWPVAPGAGRHAAQHFVEPLAGSAPALADLDPPALCVPDALRAWGARWLEAHLAGDVRPLAVHPGSGGRRKCWPPEQFAELIRRRGEPVLLIEGPADAEACRAVREGLGGRVPLATARDLEVPQLAALLLAAGGYAGNDSGVTHLAAALGLPALAIFGPTDAAVWRPLGKCATVIQPPCGAAWPTVDDGLGALPPLIPARFRAQGGR